MKINRLLKWGGLTLFFTRSQIGIWKRPGRANAVGRAGQQRIEKGTKGTILDFRF